MTNPQAQAPSPYPPYQAPPVLEPDDTVQHYGAKILAYLLAQDEVYGLLSDSQLQAASVAAGYAVTRRYDKDEPTTAKTLETLQTIKSRITRVLARRQEEQLRLPDPPPLDQADQEEQRDGGTKVPAPPYPPTRPSPAAAERPPVPVARPTAPAWSF